MKKEIEWWRNKKKTAKMHEWTKWLIDSLFDMFDKCGIKNTFSDQMYINAVKRIYEGIELKGDD